MRVAMRDYNEQTTRLSQNCGRRDPARDPSSAPDAVQDARLTATERLSQFRGDGSVKAWVSKMVVNACRCQARGRKNG